MTDRRSWQNEEKAMNRCRLFATIGTVVTFALTAHAQQARPNAGEYAGVPTVESQLAVLTEKLELTADQQEKVRPILKGLHDATEKLMQDKSLSQEERLAKVRPDRYKADEGIRAELSEEQKKKAGRIPARAAP